ncbi:MAG: hypothetical protein MK212_01955 [Saprospiraceae bacterium]|nr:hypothetical protein [Saprospiraceae bacterium]
MGKILAREFLWLFVALVFALPLGIGFLWFLGFTPETVNLQKEEKSYIFWLYLLGYLVSFLGIYIVRFVAMSIKTLTQPPAPVEEEE